VATEADATVEEYVEKKHTTIEEFLEAVFYMRPALRLYISGTEAELQSVVSSRECE
jgi:hypothetical protein